MPGVIAALFLAVACSEDWDNHYDKSDNAGTQTVLELVNADPDLSTFAKMLEISGYDELLSSSQTFTVFAPCNSALADVDLNDVDAVTRIVLNHIARFNNSTSATGENISVKMHNGKRHEFGSGTFGGVALDRTDIIATNGVLHTLKAQIPYAYNFREYMDVHSSTSMISSFLKRFDEEEMDLSASRPIGVDENGATVYDSVMYDYNAVLQHSTYGIGDIANEDSLFTMIIPDNIAWQKAYDKILPYYKNYNADDAQADSIADVQASLAIVQDLVYRRQITAPASEIDLMSTSGSEINDPAFLFSGTTMEQASNGIMYLTSNLNYDNTVTWNKMLEVEGEEQEGRTAASSTTIYSRTVSSDNILFDSISESKYIEVVATSTSRQPGVTITIPQVLACEYDIYVSCVPGIVTDTLNLERTRLQFVLTYMGEDGKNKNATFNDDDFITSETEMTWIKVTKDEPFTFPVANYYDMLWLIDPAHTSNDRVNTTKLLIQTNVSSKEFKDNELVRTFRIDRVVFVPIKK